MRLFSFVCISLAVLTPLNSFAQYRGGINQGFIGVATDSAQNTLPDIYFGGVNDGMQFAIANDQNVIPIIYLGGVGDGFTTKLITNQNGLPEIYNGGANDGSAVALANNQNSIPDIYMGGNSDGVHLSIALSQNALPEIYTGGTNDGYDHIYRPDNNSPCSGDLFVWTGTVSDDWHNADNWECRVLPGLYSEVLIPEGLSAEGYYYPIVYLEAEVSMIRLRPGAYLQVEPGVLFKLNGL